jgi:exopolysaccharide biosynthesis polyprenyl glycosylphosphotransferase
MLAGLPLVTVARLPLRGWAAVAKGIEDRLIAAAILVLIAPLLAVIAVLIKLDSPGPVLFSQNRYGWNNEPIRILKFRTLHHHANDKAAGTLVTRNDSRVTRLGGLLRRTSLDELPQFINVLRGEMSIVGPRPHAAAAKAGGLLYDEAVEYYHARHRVKPGITGWAQVNGWRGETRTVEQIKARVDHDLYYIDHWSLAFDLRIIVKTVLCGFVGRQAY